MTPFLLLLYILDTGNWIGVRYVVVFGLMLISLPGLRIRLSHKPVLAWFVLILTMVPSFIVGVGSGIELVQSLPYVYPVLIFPPLYWLVGKSQIGIDELIYAGLMFAGVIILISIGNRLGVSEIQALLRYLENSPSAGFFSMRSTFLDQEFQGIYFKGTLLLVPIGVLCAIENRWVGFTLVISALIIAQTKFGIATLIVFSARSAWNSSKTVVRLFSLTVFVAIISQVAHVLSSDSADVIELGYVTRYEHAVSMVSLWRDDWWSFVTGTGAGSRFYTSGFDGYTDDSEVSQLEALRRYGVFFVVTLFGYFVSLFNATVSQRRSSIGFSLVSFFVAAGSNPVMLSTPAILFYTVIANCVFNQAPIFSPEMSNRQDRVLNCV